MMKTTVALIKPDLFAHPHFVREILTRIEREGFRIVRQRQVDCWSASDAERFYHEHRSKFFFARLCGYMTR